MANYVYINSTGVIVPDTGTLLSTVQSEFRTAFGDDLIVTPDTPQGVLITAEVTARDAVVRNNAALANQINPNLAEGVFLDAICQLTGLQRIAATRSVVSANLTGVAGTIIPVGTRAQTTAGNIFMSAAPVTLDVSGMATVNFESEDFGPIPCTVNSLTQIVDAVLGWETITNPGSATLGISQQTDQSLRALRRNTLALQGISIGEAITSELYGTAGVRSLTFRENIAATTQVIDGITMVAHSIYVCVDGGTDLAVATALLNNKTVGAAWNGDTTVVVTEPFSEQDYTVKFDRPDEVNINVRVTMKSIVSLTDPVTTVKEAIMAYANGELEGDPGFTVGNDVSSFELAGAIQRMDPPIFVKKVEISDDNGATWQVDQIVIDLDEVARTDESRILVVIE